MYEMASDIGASPYPTSAPPPRVGRQGREGSADVGLVSIAPRYPRIARCSVASGALPELVQRLEEAIGELAARRPRC